MHLDVMFFYKFPFVCFVTFLAMKVIKGGYSPCHLLMSRLIYCFSIITLGIVL